MPIFELVKDLFKRQGRKDVIYSSAVCSDCQDAERFFREHQIDIEVKKIEEAANREELQEKHGRVLVPTIILGGEKFIGFEQNREKIEKRLGLVER